VRPTVYRPDPTETLVAWALTGVPRWSVERRVIGDAFEQFQGFQLLGGQPGRLLVALGIADVPADEEDPGRAVDVEDDRQVKERVLAR